MARIGIDARLYGVASGTGIGRYVEELISSMAYLLSPSPDAPAGTGRSPSPCDGEGEDVSFVVFLRRDGFDAFDPPNDRWSKVLADFRPYTLGVQTRYPRLIRDARVNLMHFTHFDHPIRCPVPFVTTIHDLILLHHPSIRASTLGPLRFWMKYHAYRAVLRHALRASRMVLTPSETIRQQLHNELHIPLARITATALGADHVTRHQVSAISSRIPPTPYLLYIGNAYPHKHLETLIASMATCRKRPELHDLSLVLVGRADDFTRRLQAKTTASPWVIWYGATHEKERTQLVRNAAAYVTLSADEGFDLPTVEALAAGTPVIASDIPVHREILGDAAMLLRESDVNTFAEAIADLVVNRSPTGLRARLGANGPAHAARYQWRACAQQTLRVYRDALQCLDVEPPRRRDERVADPPTTSPPRSSSPTSTRG
ncbi:MAG: glycosyltransferase family 1 protein [bacterium]|nr:glycosyltransferase family 1 protein [bacterium]